MRQSFCKRDVARAVAAWQVAAGFIGNDSCLQCARSLALFFCVVSFSSLSLSLSGSTTHSQLSSDNLPLIASTMRRSSLVSDVVGVLFATSPFLSRDVCLVVFASKRVASAKTQISSTDIVLAPNVPTPPLRLRTKILFGMGEFGLAIVTVMCLRTCASEALVRRDVCRFCFDAASPEARCKRSFGDSSSIHFCWRWRKSHRILQVRFEDICTCAHVCVFSRFVRRRSLVKRRSRSGVILLIAQVSDAIADPVLGTKNEGAR